MASRTLSPSLLWSPPLDTVTFIWGTGETGSANTLQGGAGAQPGSASSPLRDPSLWAEAWGGGTRGTAKHLQPTTAHSYPEWERNASEGKGRALSGINCYQLCLSFPPAGPADGCKESWMASGPMGRPALFHSTRAGHGASRQAGGSSPPLPACTSRHSRASSVLTTTQGGRSGLQGLQSHSPLCVLGPLLNLSVPQFCHLQSEASSTH